MTRDANLVIGTWNTHVGIALRNGGLEWLLDRAPAVHVWCLQEIRDVDHVRRALKDAGQLRRWRILPGDGYDVQDDRGHDPALPITLVRRDRRFDVAGVVHRNITYGGRYQRRALTVGLDDQLTGRDMLVANVHVNPLGKGFADANPHAREIHERQVQAYVDTLMHVADPGDVLIAAGDFNEQLGERRDYPAHLKGRTARARLAARGLFPAHAAPGIDGSRVVRLDDVFANRAGYVEARRRRVLNPPVQGNDHLAVVVRYRIGAR